MPPQWYPPCFSIIDTRLTRSFGAVFGTALFAVIHARGVEHASKNVITHRGQIFDATPSDEYHRVFHEIVPFARNIGRDFKAIGQPDTRDFTQG